ncbi:hypothetical protein [Kibdelosporangium phytohabitans]|uniref:ESX-1 secretion-associated protein n=1 Tax=Kibdelosporangium phytohabitans TaxID=860235 RepID=A0A0N9HX96_9PSEU|nr:hypothetical protein [Kibdelosporangium phytohabitans]ALG06797.1 hypothetical protein AOZ06_07535 [Kibdelosporangium phytohabitans]MBE1468036.1 hypothetical protein [Kibdelosporangium phytohabitans]
MSEGYEVVLGALAAHARQVNGVADEIRGVSGHAATKLPSDALGEIGQPFTALMDQLVAAGNRALEASANAVHATAADIVRSKDELGYRENETGQGFGGVGG